MKNYKIIKQIYIIPKINQFRIKRKWYEINMVLTFNKQKAKYINTYLYNVVLFFLLVM